MGTYLEFLSKNCKPDSKESLAFNALLEKGTLVFGNATEFRLWLNKSYFNTDQECINVDSIMDEIERLAQGYCV